MCSIIKKLIAIAAIALLPLPVLAGTKVLDYGFEDWSGWSGTTSPANGWIFTQSSEEYFIDCRDSVVGTTGGENCGGGSAYSGSYYLHTEYQTSSTDSCLGGVANSVNHRLFMGYNGSYPLSGTYDTTDFSTAIISNTASLRFRFRVTGDWSSSNDTDGGGGLKFIRWGVAGHVQTDSGAFLIMLLNDGDSETPRFEIYNYNGGDEAHNYFTPSINWQDGLWHSFTLKAIANGGGSYTLSIYLDDWDMENTALGSATVQCDESATQFYMCGLNGNWSAVYPSNLMGMDFDDIEVWDGTPDVESSPVSKSGCNPIGCSSTGGG